MDINGQTKYGFIDVNGNLITDIMFDKQTEYENIEYDFENKPIPVMIKVSMVLLIQMGIL